MNKAELNTIMQTNYEKLGLIIETGFKLYIILRKYIEDDNINEEEGQII